MYATCTHLFCDEKYYVPFLFEQIYSFFYWFKTKFDIIFLNDVYKFFLCASLILFNG